MKKLFLFVLALGCSVMSFAGGMWIEDFKAGDPMKGSQDRYTYTCMGDGGMFFYTSTNRKSFLITSVKTATVFPFDYVLEVDEWRINGKVGLYDKDGNFIKVFNFPFKQTKGYTDRARSRCTEEEAEEILSFIENEEGTVRVILPCYQDKDFDVSFPCKKSADPAPKPKKNRR